MREEKSLRLFFALWPDEKVRDQIELNLRILPPTAGRIVPRHNWHMTLHFIGNTSLDEKNCLHRQAKKLRSAKFNLTIGRCGYFKKPKVFWFGCEQTPQALLTVQQNLGILLSECQYEPETRHYSPHITVARKVLTPPEQIEVKPIQWHVDRFVLIESISIKDGVRYDVIEQYSLS